MGIYYTIMYSPQIQSFRPKSVREILNQIGAVHSGFKLKKEEFLNEPVTQLQILNGSESKRIVALNQIIAAKENNILRIGWQDKAKRNKSNDIGIQEEFTKFVSSAHATMEYERKNWYIRDGQWIKTKSGKIQQMEPEWRKKIGSR
ncbi:MAG: hypothetical protein IPL98_16200 [Saprospiraceae bacterium]|nr:hypothetical protein [Saprospiraceae bacterium]